MYPQRHLPFAYQVKMIGLFAFPENDVSGQEQKPPTFLESRQPPHRVIIAVITGPLSIHLRKQPDTPFVV